MKKKLKQFWRVVVLAMIVLLVGCEKEVYEDNLYHDNIHKQTITLKELQQQHPLAFSKYQKVDAECKKARQNRKNIQGKLVYDDNLGFFIDTDKIIYMEKDGYKCYTFPIKREYEEEKVENLILNFSNNDDYKAFISKYNFTDSEKEMLKEGVEIPNFLQRMTLVDFEGNTFVNNGVFNRLVKREGGKCYVVDQCPTNDINDASWIEIDCSTVGGGDIIIGGGGTGTGGDGGSNNTGGAWADGTTISGNPWYGADTGINNNGSYYSTNPYAGSGGANGSANGENTSNGGNTTNNSTQGTPQTNPHQLGYVNPHTGVLTVPLLPADDLDIESMSGPCELIRKLQGDDGFKSMMNILKQAAMSWTREKLYTVYDDPTPNAQTGQVDNYDYTTFDAPVGAQTAGYTYYTNIKGVIHSHFAGYGSIFSPDDLVGLYNIINNPDISSNDFFYGVVTNDGTAYIMQIKDKQKFLAFGQMYLATVKKVENLADDLYGRKYNINQNNSATTNEKNFLKMMKEKDMGITLSGLTFDTSAGAPNTPDIFNTWNNKDYDQNSNSILNSNCN